MKRFLLIPLLLCGVAPARAHEGPPFPIVVDQRVGPYVASVWTDPDIGTGTFFVILEPPEGAELPPQTEVRVAVEPLDKHLAETIYEAELQPVRYGERHFTETKFDQGGLWRVRVLIESPQGGGELTSQVEPTPDGTIGPIALVLYALPFLAVGFLWLKAVLRRKEGAAGETISPAGPGPDR
ncbi:MAG TPA: hypothetical protein VLE27_08280 [Thermoanaerobaculia bacterium]|nr:hypothetical protein [Thermoanaerobaculia bacterium]